MSNNLSNLVGRTIGKYQIVEHLGRGGMAEVFKAYQPSLDRHVALKLMHAFLVEDQDFIARFEREAKNVAALRHPHIVQVYDFDVQDGMPFMVMEFIEGGTLKTHLENLASHGEVLPQADAVRIMREVGSALAYAHKRGVIHRDVKPANVMMDSSGRAILTDFGIAKILTGPSHTATGATIGTPAYMAPEQGMGRPGDHRSDIYSLGVMLYQFITGELPFDADTPLAVMLKHVNDPLPLPRSIRPSIPEGLERIVLKAMAKNPDDRFQSVDEMLGHLGNLESATLIAVPSASMAAGGASAATLAAPGGALPVAGRSTADTAPGVPGAVPAAETTRPGRAMTPIYAAAAVVGLLLILGIGGGALVLGGGLARATATAPATLAPTTLPSATEPARATPVPGSPTPDAQATALHSIQLTNQALVQALATATPTNTPDLTQTAAACVYGYELVSVTPDPERSLGVNSRPISVTLNLMNTGTCAYPSDTTLVETSPGDDHPLLAVPTLSPAATGVVSMTWTSLTRPGTQTRTWEMRLPDGRTVGDPLSVSFDYVVFATAVPTAPPTLPPPPATATSSVGKVFDLSVSYLSCSYSAGDYTCIVQVHITGGQAPFTIFLDGVSRFGDLNHPVTIPIVGRRCLSRPFTLQVLDNFGSNYTESFLFDPVNNASLFPGGGCTLP